MTTTWPIPFVLFFLSLPHSLSHWLEAVFQKLIRLHPDSLVRRTLADRTYTKTGLITENALLRHQLAILHRQVKRPTLNHHEQFGLLLLACRLRAWKHALLIIQPVTIVRWHRQGFHLFWGWKSRAKSKRAPFSTDVIILIQRMGRENPA